MVSNEKKRIVNKNFVVFLIILAISALKKLNCHSAEAVMIGDRPLTDILAGKLLGCKTILVGSINIEDTLDLNLYNESSGLPLFTVPTKYEQIFCFPYLLYVHLYFLNNAFYLLNQYISFP